MRLQLYRRKDLQVIAYAGLVSALGVVVASDILSDTIGIHFSSASIQAIDFIAGGASVS